MFWHLIFVISDPSIPLGEPLQSFPMESKYDQACRVVNPHF